MEEQKDFADYVDTLTLGMKEVLAEIDQETDVIDDFWRHARETKYGKVMQERTNLGRLLRRITESKKVVMSIKDEGGFRAWQRLKQRYEFLLVDRQGHRHCGVPGHGGPTGQAIALLTQMDRKMKLV